MQVFISDIDSIRKDWRDWMRFLSPENQTRAEKFQKPARRLQFILAHLMADNIGKKYTSIAHKDNFVVVATSQSAPVGVDIENTSVQRDFVGSAELMGAAAPKTLIDFYKFFTKTEAAYKLHTTPTCTRFLTHDNYLICVVSNRRFAAQRLKIFDIKSIFPPK